MNSEATSRRAFLRGAAMASLSLASASLLAACGGTAPAPASPPASASSSAVATSRSSASLSAATSSAATGSASASAAAKYVPITSVAYGGVWEKAVKEAFVGYYKKQTGQDATILLGTPAEWVTKVKATQPKPAIDVLLTTGTFTFQARDQGLVVPLDESKAPNLKDVPDFFKERFGGYAACFDAGGQALAYNKEKFPNPPDSWRDLVEGIASGKFGNRVMWPGLTGSIGPDIFWTVNVAMGGDIDNVQPGLDAMKRMKPYISKFFIDMPSAGEALVSREADMAVWADGRLWALVVGGAKHLSFKYLKPKSPLTAVEVLMVKNAPESAWVYVNGMFDPEAQSAFIKYFPGYLVTNTKARYDKTGEEFLEPSIKDKTYSAFYFPPYDKMAPLLPKWTEMWNKQIGA